MFGLMMGPMTNLTCGKCNGTGAYLDFGGCYACGGTGRLRVTPTAAARIKRAIASRDLHHSASCAAADGRTAAREWIRAHRDDEEALNLMWAALHDEGMRAEGDALFAWMANRFGARS